MENTFEQLLEAANIPNPYDKSTSKGTTESKLQTLEEKRNAKIDKLGSVAENLNLSNDTYTVMPEGTIESNKNKVWNDKNDAEKQFLLGYATSKYFNDSMDPQKSRRLYHYNTKDGQNKLGASSGGYHTSDIRYDNTIDNKYNDEWRTSGKEGPDLSKKILDIPMDFEATTVLEGIYHGNADNLKDRKVKDYLSKEALNHESGVSEYYRGDAAEQWGDTSKIVLSDEKQKELMTWFDGLVEQEKFKNKRDKNLGEGFYKPTAEGFKAVESSDKDNRFAEAIDLAQSTGLKLWADMSDATRTASRSIVKAFGGDPDKLGLTENPRLLGTDRLISEIKKNEKLRDTLTGYESRDLWTEEQKKFSEAVKGEKYGQAAWNVVTNLDRYLAQSAPEMGLLMTPIVGMPTLVGTRLNNQMEEFEKENGRPMTATEAIATAATITATLVPEKLLVKTGGKKVLENLSKRGGKAREVAIGVGVSTGGEALQEGAEAVQEQWATGKAEDRTSLDKLGEYVTSDETIGGVIAGGVMGGGLRAAGETAAVTPKVVSGVVKEIDNKLANLLPTEEDSVSDLLKVSLGKNPDKIQEIADIANSVDSMKDEDIDGLTEAGKKEVISSIHGLSAATLIDAGQLKREEAPDMATMIDKQAARLAKVKKLDYSDPVVVDAMKAEVGKGMYEALKNAKNLTSEKKIEWFKKVLKLSEGKPEAKVIEDTVKDLVKDDLEEVSTKISEAVASNGESLNGLEVRLEGKDKEKLDKVIETLRSMGSESLDNMAAELTEIEGILTKTEDGKPVKIDYKDVQKHIESTGFIFYGNSYKSNKQHEKDVVEEAVTGTGTNALDALEYFVSKRDDKVKDEIIVPTEDGTGREVRELSKSSKKRFIAVTMSDNTKIINTIKSIKDKLQGRNVKDTIDRLDSMLETMEAVQKSYVTTYTDKLGGTGNELRLAIKGIETGNVKKPKETKIEETPEEVLKSGKELSTKERKIMAIKIAKKIYEGRSNEITDVELAFQQEYGNDIEKVLQAAKSRDSKKAVINPEAENARVLEELLSLDSSKTNSKVGGGYVEDVTDASIYDEDVSKGRIEKPIKFENLMDNVPEIPKEVKAWIKKRNSKPVSKSGKATLRKLKAASDLYMKKLVKALDNGIELPVEIDENTAEYYREKEVVVNEDAKLPLEEVREEKTDITDIYMESQKEPELAEVTEENVLKANRGSNEKDKKVLAKVRKDQQAKVREDEKKAVETSLGKESAKWFKTVGNNANTVTNKLVGVTTINEVIEKLGEYLPNSVVKNGEAFIKESVTLFKKYANGKKRVKIADQKGKLAFFNELMTKDKDRVELALDITGVIVAKEMMSLKMMSESELEEHVESAFPFIEKGSVEFAKVLNDVKTGEYVAMATFRQAAGTRLLAELGLKFDTANITGRDIGDITAGLGQIAIERMKNDSNNKGLKGKWVLANGEIVNSNTNNKSGTRILTLDVKNKEMFDKTGTLLEYASEKTDGVLNVSGPVVLENGAKGRRTNTKIADEDTEYINDHNKIEWSFTDDANELLSKINEEQMFDIIAGKEVEVDGKTVEEIETELANREALRLNIKRMYLGHGIAGKDPFWYSWVKIANGRFMIDNKMMNPQNSKIVRFLVSNKDMTSTFKLEDIPVIRAAIAQAFEFGIDKGTDVNVAEEMKKELVSIDDDGKVTYARTEKGNKLKAAVSKYSRGNVRGALVILSSIKDIEANNIMHAYQTLNVLANIESGEGFEHNLTIEADGITNGMAHTLLEIGGEPVKKLLEKAGVYFDSGYKSHGEFKEAGEQDIYETPKDRLVELIDRDNDLANIVTDVIGNKWRNALKPLVMVFIYGASITSIKQKAGETFLEAVMKDIAKTGGADKIKRLLKAADVITDKVKVVELRNGKLINRWVSLDRLSNEDAKKVKWDGELKQELQSKIVEVFGEPIEDAFNEAFPEIGRYRQALKSVNMIGFTVFKSELNKKLKGISKDRNTVTVKELNSILAEMMKEGTYYGTELDTGVIHDMVKMTDVKDGETVEVMGSGTDAFVGDKSKMASIPVNVNSVMKWFDMNIGAVGVIDIHQHDGANMRRGNVDGTLNIYDAIVLAANKSKATKNIIKMNKAFIDGAREHSVMGSVVDKVAKMVKVLDIETLIKEAKTDEELVEMLHAGLVRVYGKDLETTGLSGKILEIKRSRETVGDSVLVNQIYVTDEVPGVKASKGEVANVNSSDDEVKKLEKVFNMLVGAVINGMRWKNATGVTKEDSSIIKKHNRLGEDLLNNNC